MPVYLAIQVPSGKLTAGLRQLPIPTKMMLTVIVILRFMPTILSEFSDVKDAMRTRGFYVLHRMCFSSISNNGVCSCPNDFPFIENRR